MSHKFLMKDHWLEHQSQRIYVWRISEQQHDVSSIDHAYLK